MSTPTARRLVTASGLSLALALASPSAAFADHKDGHDGGGDKGATPTASPSPAGQGSGSQGSGSQGGKASGGKGGGTQSSNGKGSSQGKGGKGGKESGKAGGDPRGNNGTVKIDGEPFDSTPGNEPHVGCTFQVDFFGFDAGDTALVTLTGHAPTGGGQLYSQRHTISTDPAGGGKDVDESITFTAAQLGLFSITPHPKQGWHIKLAADVDGAPGGAKQKVFWVTCAQPGSVSGTTTAPATGGGGTTTTATGAGAGTTTTLTGGGGAAATNVVSTRAVERSVEAQSFGAGATTLNGTSTSAASGAGAATVAARGNARPSALPFTGVEGLGYLVALGAAALGVGTLAHRLGRRRAVSTEA